MHRRTLLLALTALAISPRPAARPRPPFAVAVALAHAGPVTVTTPEQAIARVIASSSGWPGSSHGTPTSSARPSWYEVKPASGVGAFVVTCASAGATARAAASTSTAGRTPSRPTARSPSLSEDGGPCPRAPGQPGRRPDRDRRDGHGGTRLPGREGAARPGLRSAPRRRSRGRHPGRVRRRGGARDHRPGRPVRCRSRLRRIHRRGPGRERADGQAGPRSRPRSPRGRP